MRKHEKLQEWDAEGRSRTVRVSDRKCDACGTPLIWTDAWQGWDCAVCIRAERDRQTDAEGRSRTVPSDSQTVHDLKTWPDYFNALLDGRKTFEYRRNDRGFKVGDTLLLREWEPLQWASSEPTCGRYTGREMRRRVTYLLNTSVDFVVMALTPPTASRPVPPERE